MNQTLPFFFQKLYQHCDNILPFFAIVLPVVYANNLIQSCYTICSQVQLTKSSADLLDEVFHLTYYRQD